MYETMLAEQPENVDTARMGGVGGVDRIREYMRRFEDVGVDQIMFLLPPVPHDRIMESLERFGREMLPEFIERDAVTSEEKARRMQPVIERATSRRVDGRRPVDPTYEITGVPVSWDGLQVTEIVDTLAKIAAEQESAKVSS
jgi:hypothetical protein